MKLVLCLGVTGFLAACVAPEAPPPPKPVAAQTAQPTSRVGFEDAPLPNRKVGPVRDSIIQMGK